MSGPAAGPGGAAADADTADVVEEAGRFRIYMGAAPGVGKTFAMLNEGRRRARRGAEPGPHGVVEHLLHRQVALGHPLAQERLGVGVEGDRRPHDGIIASRSLTA